MITAMLGGRRKTIETLDDLAEAAQLALRAYEPLILIGDNDERFVFPPAEELPPLDTTGPQEGVVDHELLVRHIYAARGQFGRGWKVAEDDSVTE
jgi:hypothetical protein